VDTSSDQLQSIKAQIKSCLSNYKKNKIIDDNTLPAGVIIPLFEKEGAIYVLLTLRTETVATHKGQISFPGGAWEPGDSSILDTALRETQEEVGIKPEDFEIIGELDDVVAVSDHLVTPFVGFFPYPYDFKVSDVEIAELVEIPLDFFLDDSNRRSGMREHRGKRVTIHYYDYNEHTVWGLTAHILKGFLDLCFGAC